MTTMAFIGSTRHIELTSEIVAAYVTHNAVPAGELANLIKTVHQSLGALGSEVPDDKLVEPAKPTPAVPIKKSVTDTHIICLEDGKALKSMKRHLMTAYGLTPEAYRKRWGLDDKYPMTAPAYARIRSELAKKGGLGKNRSGDGQDPTVARDAIESNEGQPAKQGRGRPKKT